MNVTINGDAQTLIGKLHQVITLLQEITASIHQQEIERLRTERDQARWLPRRGRPPQPAAELSPEERKAQARQRKNQRRREARRLAREGAAKKPRP